MSNNSSVTFAKNAGTELHELRYAKSLGLSFPAKGVSMSSNVSPFHWNNSESSGSSAYIDRNRNRAWPPVAASGAYRSTLYPVRRYTASRNDVMRSLNISFNRWFSLLESAADAEEDDEEEEDGALGRGAAVDMFMDWSTSAGRWASGSAAANAATCAASCRTWKNRNRDGHAVDHEVSDGARQADAGRAGRAPRTPDRGGA